MDFVVAGLGFGALLIVIGFVVRDLGPLLWRSRVAGAADEALRLRRGRVHLCHAISSALMIGGGITLLATVAAVAAGVGDGMGSLVVLVAAIVSVALAGLLVATVVRAYQATTPVLMPLGRTAAKSTSLSTPDGGALTSVRRVAKPAREPEPAEPAQPVQPDQEVAAAEIAVFDPNKLLASEIDHDSDDDDPMLPRRPDMAPPVAEPASERTEAVVATSAPAAPETIELQSPAEAVPSEETIAEPAAPAFAPPARAPAEASPTVENEGRDEVLSVTVRPLTPVKPTAEPVSDSSVEPASEAQSAGASVPPAPVAAPPSSEPERPATEPVFQSRLLADIGPDTGAENGTGFASGLLADVADSEPAAATFKSPLLADLLPPVQDDSSGEHEPSDHDPVAAHKRRSLFSRRHSRR